MEGRKRSGMLKKSVYNMRETSGGLRVSGSHGMHQCGCGPERAAYAATSSSESVTFRNDWFPNW